MVPRKFVKINHLIIGAKDASKSADFYCRQLGYSKTGTFTDTGTGREGIILYKTSAPELLVVPFTQERLPSPQHIAFEVDAATFDFILGACCENGIKTRSEPPLDWEKEDCSEVLQSGEKFLHFYFCDPSNVNIEIMKRCS
jgi:catechol 2,3-dioxygenase-like lactoylglutathione lyase family enzyme